MTGGASISSEILGRYAADAAQEVEGVAGLVGGPLPGRRGVRVSEDGGAVAVELHVALAWGASAPDVGRAVQARVRDYLGRMAGVEPSTVDVVVAELR